MEKFKFDLQRFAEDEDVEQPTSGDSTEKDGQKPEFRLDENGRIVFLHDDDETEDPDEDVDEEPAEEDDNETDDTPAKEQAPEKYTTQQLKDLDFEDLDPKKIPDEMLPWYRSMQGAFTRKMQKLAEKEKELGQQEQPPKQEEQTPDAKLHIQGLANLARFQACQVLGIEAEDFDRTDDDHEAAYQIALIGINKAVDEAAKKERALVMFDEEMAEADADYYAIKQWAKESYINKMPYDDRIGFEHAVSTGDTKLLAKKYLPMLKEAYNKEHGKQEKAKSPVERVKEKSRVAKEPPKLEGNRNAEIKTSNKFDASELRGKTLNEQINLLVKAGLARP